MAAMQNWQYKVIQVKTDMWGRDNPEAMQTALNEAGRTGWELVSTVHAYAARATILFFKRPG